MQANMCACVRICENATTDEEKEAHKFVLGKVKLGERAHFDDGERLATYML